MKKIFKKLTALFVASLILMVSVPMQSFAAFDGVKIPVIKSIEINESSQAVSLKELDNYYTYIFEQLEKHGLSMEDFKEEFPSIYDYALNFYLSSSNFEYIFDVTLASGKEYSFSADDAYVELNRIYSLEVDSYITYENYLSAKESGADEIEVEINGCFYNNLTYDYCDITGCVTKCNLPVTEMVVKSITPLSGVPDKLYQDQTYVDIDGAEFLIEYADGRTVTATAKADHESNRYFAEYTLDGASVEVYYDFLPESEENGDEQYCELCFDYLDASCKTTAAYVEESLLKGIKITDCVFDTENLHLSSLTYELTYADGNTASFTKEFSLEEDTFSDLVTWLDNVDGYVVKLFISVGDFDADSEKINADSYYFTVGAGEVSDTYKVDNPYKDAMNGPLNVAYFFINLFTKIQDFFYNLFDFTIFGF